MKLKLVPALISVGIALLAGYGFFAANASEPQCWLMFAVTAVEFAAFFISGFGISYGRGGSNVTVLAIVFAVIGVIANLIFTFAPFATAPYIIVNGILVLLYAGIAYAIAKAL